MGFKLEPCQQNMGKLFPFQNESTWLGLPLMEEEVRNAVGLTYQNLYLELINTQPRKWGKGRSWGSDAWMTKLTPWRVKWLDKQLSAREDRLSECIQGNFPSSKLFSSTWNQPFVKMSRKYPLATLRMMKCTKKYLILFISLRNPWAIFNLIYKSIGLKGEVKLILHKHFHKTVKRTSPTIFWDQHYHY